MHNMDKNKTHPHKIIKNWFSLKSPITTMIKDNVFEGIYNIFDYLTLKICIFK
jgi:hypothetical protein